MNRRDFLNIPLEATQPKQVRRDLPITSTPTAGYPREYARNTLVLVEDARAWLGRDSLGFYAIDAACPHLGCTLRLDEDTFGCPCHNSIFTLDGQVTSGPAQRSLRFLMVDLNAEGKLVIRRDQSVSPDDRFFA